MSLTIAYFAAVVFAGIVCIFNWRKGFLVCLVAGFFQDPLRKILPNAPIYMTIMVAVFVGMTVLGAFLRGVPIKLSDLTKGNRVLRDPMYFFIIFLGFSSLMTLVRTGSVVLPVIGLIAYLSPLPAVLLASRFPRWEVDILKWIGTYVALSFLMTLGIYLSYLGIDWQALKPVGTFEQILVAFSPSGDFLNLYCGFFRAPEIAAWHAAASICFLVLLVTAAPKRPGGRLLGSLLIVYFLVALLLTGRRKGLAEIMLFVSIYGFLVSRYSKGAIRIAFVAVMGMSLLAAVLLSDAGTSGFQSDMRPYYERGASVSQEGPQRIYTMTISSFQDIIDQNGILGSGAGTGSQGSQYFGGGAELVGYSAEGGLGKILAELGIPGILLFLWLAFASLLYLWSIVKYVSAEDSARSKLTFALFAFLCSNGLVYTVAHQVFGDMFVLTILGFCMGFIVAVPRLRRSGEPASAPTTRAVQQMNTKFPTREYPRPAQ